MSRVVRVLVVDDSAYVRKVVKQMLSRSPSIEVVGTARDGREALELVAALRPDVVTCDLMMPEMDGVEFLLQQMRRKPVPVIVMSIADESCEMVLTALEAGAVDFVQKPTALATERMLEVSDALTAKVKAAAEMPLARLAMVSVVPAPAPANVLAGKNCVDIVVLGISTGGPQALRYLVPQLPAHFRVPLAIVLHLPVGYTEMYARKLDEIAAVNVREAVEGDVMQPGVVLLAPAGRHLTFRRVAGGPVVAHLDARPFNMLHRPSVDVLFQSAAETYGGRVLGVVMTGMGSDGKHGAGCIKAQGGLIYTESEETCIVYGMPGSVVEAGFSDKSLRLDQLAQAILEMT